MMTWFLSYSSSKRVSFIFYSSIKTTSPKSMQTLTKDTLNHHIWNPSKATLTDTSGQLEKFNKRFGAQSNKIDSELKEDAWKSNERDVSSENIGKNQIDELLELAVGEAPKITEKKVIVKVVETTAAKGKAAKAKVAKK
jgi:ribosomal protein L31